MNEENERYVTIAEAAKSLNVSKDTIRRRIKKGELNAQKLEGPYGYAYYINAKDLAQAQQIVDVVPVSRNLSKKELQGVVQDAVQPLADEVRQLRQEVQNLTQQLEEIKQIEAPEQKRSWWKKIFGKER